MRATIKVGLTMGAVALLSGCVADMSRFSLADKVPFFSGAQSADAGSPATGLNGSVDGEPSAVISGLLARGSVIEDGSVFQTVQRALVANSDGVAEAELRAAELKAVARSKNWLPTIGPSISLTSLGQLTAGLLIDQVLYDNGKRKAERAFAVADVDVAAVALSQDVNDRVATGLSLYVGAAQARDKAQMSDRGLGRMREFGRVVSERVKGGVSDLSDERVVQSKISEMSFQADAQREAASSAMAELSHMTAGAGLPKLARGTEISTAAPTSPTLTILRAQAEATRAEAEAKAARAGLLPTLRVGGVLAKESTSGASYEGSGLGFGTAADMRAIGASAAASAARVAQVSEQSARSISRQESQIAALKRQTRDAAGLVEQARASYRIFQDQFEAGERTVMEVMSVYEQMVQSELKHIDLSYEMVLSQIELARLRGNLVRGGDI